MLICTQLINLSLIASTIQYLLNVLLDLHLLILLLNTLQLLALPRLLWVLQIRLNFSLIWQPFHVHVYFLPVLWLLLFRNHCLWDQTIAYGFLFLVYHRPYLFELGFWEKSLFQRTVLEHSFDDSVLRNKLEAPVCQTWVNHSSLFLRVIVWTRSLSAVLFLALVGLVKHGMVRLFLPTMTHVTTGSTFTSTKVIVYHFLGIPVNARNWLIIIHWRVSSVVLPVMGINTLVLFVFSQVQDTKLCLVVKHVKILILDVVVD